MGHDFISHPNGILDQNLRGNMGEMSPKPATVYQTVLAHLSGLSQVSACKIRMMTKWKPMKRDFQKTLEALLGGK